MPECIEVPASERSRVRLALLRRLAGLIGRAVVGDAIVDIGDGGQPHPSGSSTTTAVVPEVGYDDVVCFDVADDRGAPIQIRDRRGAVTMTPRDLAGTEVDGVALPSLVVRNAVQERRNQ